MKLSCERTRDYYTSCLAESNLNTPLETRHPHNTYVTVKGIKSNGYEGKEEIECKIRNVGFGTARVKTLRKN